MGPFHHAGELPHAGDALDGPPRQLDPSRVRAAARTAAALAGRHRSERMNRELTHRTADAARRRIALYDYVYERMLPHLDRPEVLVVRYERWFTEPDALLTELGAFLGIDVSRPLARIRPPVNPAPEPTAYDERERALVRRHCRTAARLGYDLGRNSHPVAGLA